MYIWGSMVEGWDGMRRDGCLEGTPNWRIARFGWGVFVEGRDFCFEGTRNWRRSVVWLGCVCGRTGLFVLGGRQTGA